VADLGWPPNADMVVKEMFAQAPAVNL
jgi:hypothetical protein